MHKRLLLWVVLMAGCPAVWAQETPATKTADPFSTHEGPPKPAPMPSVATHDLIRFSLNNGMITVQTTLPRTTMKLYTVSSLPTPVEVTIRHRVPAVGPYTPDSIRIAFGQQHPNLYVRNEISAMPSSLNVFCALERSGDEDVTIQYIQSITILEEHPVKLFVQKLAAGAGDNRQRWEADSFTALLRSYPAEGTQYLRPILESLAPQPQLFMVDDPLDMLVFPQVVQTDPAVRQKVMELVATLDADDFQKRQQAAETLQQMGNSAVAVLGTLDRAKLQPEQAARIETILAAARPSFQINADKLRRDPGFLLDCLMSPNPAVRKAALPELQKVAGVPVGFSDPPDENQRIREVYALRKQIIPDFATTQPAKGRPQEK